jgi:hypothetical protein
MSENELNTLINKSLYKDVSLQLDQRRRMYKIFTKFALMTRCPDKFISKPVYKLYSKILEEIKMNRLLNDENMDICTHSFDDVKRALETLDNKKELCFLVSDLNPLAQAYFKNFSRNLGVWID